MNRLYISTVILFLFSCSYSFPDFNEQKAFTHLEEQCKFGTREPGSAGINSCRNYIIREMTKHGFSVSKQEFPVKIKNKNFKGMNILVSTYPEMEKRILLGAHYDTRPWSDRDSDIKNHNKPVPGANDGASGVAVLLQIAEIISKERPDQYGVDFVFFDAEDSGSYGDNKDWCLGSKYFAAHYSGEKPEKAVIVDMIGDADLRIPIEKYSYQNSPELVLEVWDIAERLGFSEFAGDVELAVYDDHVPLLEKGFEVIDIIDFDYDYWHTPEDNPDKCSASSLKVVGQTLILLIYGNE